MYNFAVFAFGQGQFEGICTLEGINVVLKFIENNIPGAHKGMDKLQKIAVSKGFRIDGFLETNWHGEDNIEDLEVLFEEISGDEGIYGCDLRNAKDTLAKASAAVWHFSLCSVQGEYSWIVIG